MAASWMFAGLCLAGCAAESRGGATPRDAAVEPDAATAVLDAATNDAAQPATPDAAADVMHRGMRGQPSPPVCTDPDDQESEAERVRVTTVGLHESRTDHCDDAGNLIEHRCEILPSTDCGPCQGECSPCVEHTGAVLEAPFDCNGDCVDGACVDWCPDQGDRLAITREAGTDALELQNLSTPGRFTCTPQQDGSTEPHCLNLDGYLGEQVYEFSTECYGATQALLRLRWSLAGSGITDATCFVDCSAVPHSS